MENQTNKIPLKDYTGILTDGYRRTYFHIAMARKNTVFSLLISVM